MSVIKGILEAKKASLISAIDLPRSLVVFAIWYGRRKLAILFSIS